MSDCAARQALRRLSESVTRLGGDEDGKTLFEGSPSRSQVCFDAWMELHSAQKEAREVLATPCPPAAPVTRQQAEQMAIQTACLIDITGRQREALIAAISSLLQRVSGADADAILLRNRQIDDLQRALAVLEGEAERVKELEARLERMTNLVRYQRHLLYEEALIIMQVEGAVSRLEGYDAMRCALRSLRDAVNAKLNRAGEPSGSLEAALTHADAVLAKEKADG